MLWFAWQQGDLCNQTIRTPPGRATVNEQRHNGARERTCARSFRCGPSYPYRVEAAERPTFIHNTEKPWPFER